MGVLRVSVSEAVEVRGGGLTIEELLALASGGALAALAPSSTSSTACLFDPDHIFVTHDGTVHIERVSREEIDEQFLPPELLNGDVDDSDAAREAQMVFCLGASMRWACGERVPDADFFSFLNLLTVAMVSTRPRLEKVPQMVKNKMHGVEPRVILESIYEEIMGDEELDDSMSQGSHSLADSDNDTTNGKIPVNTYVLPEKRSDGEERHESSTESSIHSLPIREKPVKVATRYEEKEDDEDDDFFKKRRTSADEDDIVQVNDISDPFLDQPRSLVFAHGKEEDEEEEERRRAVPPVPPVPPSPPSSLSPISEESPPLVESSMRSQASHSVTTSTPPRSARFRPSASDDDDAQRAHVEAVVIHEKGQAEAKDSDEEDIDGAFAVAPALPVPIAPSPLHHRDNSDVSRSSFTRHNSLVPSRISGHKPRSSMNKKRTAAKTSAVPEFVEKQNLPSIRLKAPTARKSEVWVELLSGQKIEVSCRTDARVHDVFSLVVAHMNLNEHVFFGLTVLRDGEHFFLDDNQRLEKFAPAGWKGEKRANGVFVLHLRFRFYPQILDFVKTDVTMHELYLQLRRDVLEGRLEPSSDVVYELGALALQAEFADRPPPKITSYFLPEHYLPKCELRDPRRATDVLAEVHSHYAGTSPQEAERRFIELCQRQIDFGGHFYRVSRHKERSVAGDNLFIAIMPRGLVVFETLRGRRQPVSEHVWQRTQTLQFDKKKFVVVSLNGESDEVFYTEHHSKSSYFVSFAASQHRFMMKMRQWKSTLRNESAVAAHPDVAIDAPCSSSSSPSNCSVSTSLEVRAKEMFGETSPRVPPVPSHSHSHSHPVPPQHSSTPKQPDVLNVSFPSANRSLDFSNNNDSINTTLAARLDEASDDPSQGRIFTVSLHKDPQAGLGLTLVDGDLAGVRGVYVKSVSEGGAGEKNGLAVGDQLLAVNGVSLEGKDRHAAVALVKESDEFVELRLLRPDVFANSQHRSKGNGIAALSSSFLDVSRATASSSSLAAPQPSASRGGIGVSRTPPAPRRTPQRRTRAVSDFGAIGDMLPALNSDDLLADMRKISGLSEGDWSDEERERGEYRLPVSSLYNFDHDEDEVTTGRSTEARTSHTPATPSHFVQTPNKGKRMTPRKSNLDWTEELEEVGEADEDMVLVSLERNHNGSLGVQIASINGEVCIKQVTAEPALSNPDLRVGDVLVEINGEPVDGRSHHEVVQMLKHGGQIVELALRRQSSAPKEIIVKVILQKSATGSLGLSLAKRTGLEGIYIRMIGAGSAADEDGRLKVGDRLWMVDGESVAERTPASVVEQLKALRGPVEIVVKRLAQ